MKPINFEKKLDFLQYNCWKVGGCDVRKGIDINNRQEQIYVCTKCRELKKADLTLCDILDVSSYLINEAKDVAIVDYKLEPKHSKENILVKTEHITLDNNSIQNERKRNVGKSVEWTSKQCSRVLDLYYNQNKKKKEIVELTGLNIKTISKIITLGYDKSKKENYANKKILAELVKLKLVERDNIKKLIERCGLNVTE